MRCRPLAAWLGYFGSGISSSTIFMIFLSVILIGSVLAAVYHAELVAHKVGEPFGTIILALAVTIIEVSLIVSLISTGGEKTAALVGGAKFREQFIIKHSASSALIVLTAILILTLVVANYTTSRPGPVYTTPQLIIASLVSPILYGSFIMIQYVRHRDYFLPKDAHNGDS